MPRIVDTRPLRARIMDCTAEIDGGARVIMFDTERAVALCRAYDRRRATLAAWGRAVAVTNEAFYDDWTPATPGACATYYANLAILRAAGMVGPDDVAVGR